MDLLNFVYWLLWLFGGQPSQNGHEIHQEQFCSNSINKLLTLFSKLLIGLHNDNVLANFFNSVVNQGVDLFETIIVRMEA